MFQQFVYSLIKAISQWAAAELLQVVVHGPVAVHKPLTTGPQWLYQFLAH